MKLLIDLSILRHPYCGLGQIAQGYGRYLAGHADFFPSDWEVTLLLPKGWENRFGSHLSYLVQQDCYRPFPFLLPHFDVWHSIHQLSAFRPASRSTRRVLTIHDLNFLYEKQGGKRRRYLKRLQHDVDSASEVCFISRFAQADAVRWLDFGDRPTSVVYNGVSSVTDGPQEGIPGLEDGKPFFLSIGVVRAKKNLHVLLPMMELMGDYRLVVAGDDGGDYARRLREQAAGCPPVHIVGPVDDAQRRWLYSHCSGLLFPSLSEGFGLPVIEAMQWGKPVFCSRLTSLPEVGATHAFYFDSFEPEAMAATVRKGLSEFNEQRSREEQAYAAGFSWDKHMDCYLRIYQRWMTANK